eukprot:tig00020562_g11170.t1
MGASSRPPNTAPMAAAAALRTALFALCAVHLLLAPARAQVGSGTWGVYAPDQDGKMTEVRVFALRAGDAAFACDTTGAVGKIGCAASVSLALQNDAVSIPIWEPTKGQTVKITSRQLGTIEASKPWAPPLELSFNVAMGKGETILTLPPAEKTTDVTGEITLCEGREMTVEQGPPTPAESEVPKDPVPDSGRCLAGGVRITISGNSLRDASPPFLFGGAPVLVPSTTGELLALFPIPFCPAAPEAGSSLALLPAYMVGGLPGRIACGAPPPGASPADEAWPALAGGDFCTYTQVRSGSGSNRDCKLRISKAFD